MKLEELFYEAIVRASTSVPVWLTEILEECSKSSSGYARIVLETLVRAARVSAEKRLPLCQDTGTPLLVVRRAAFSLEELWKAFRLAVRRATLDGFLRPNSLDPIGGGFENDNSSLPYIVPATPSMEDGNVLLDAVVLLRGGGAEHVSLVTAGSSTELEERIAATALEAAVRAEAKPCPPYILSVGVGATLAHAVAAAYTGLAYRTPKDRVRWSCLEKRLAERLEKLLDIGPAGVGGKPTILQTWINMSHVHPASAAIAVVFQCWPLRRARVLVEAGEEKVLVI